MTPVRLVVIGAGAHIFAAAHVPAIDRVNAEVVGLYDADPSRAEALASERGWELYRDLKTLLAADADAAVITAPHPAHAELVLASLRAGLHVLVEKPIAVSVDQADAIAAEAASLRLTVAVALQHRLRAEVQHAKRIVACGGIGELHRAEVAAYYPKRSAYYSSSPWRGTWAGEGGGVVINQGQHDLDLLAHLAGRPARVFGWMRTRVQPIETEDTAEAILEWPSGATGTIHISSAALARPRLLLVGTAGVLRILPGELRFDENDADVREFSRADGRPFDPLEARPRAPVVGGGGDHTAIYDDFIGALRNGHPPVAPIADASTALELTNALTLSSCIERAVELPLDRDRYRRMLDERVAHAGAERRLDAHA